MAWFDAVLVTEAGEVPLRSLPVADLIDAALAVDEDTRVEYAAFLQLRGDRETFDAARALCASDDAVRRALGADVLGRLGALAVVVSPAGPATPVPGDAVTGPAGDGATPAATGTAGDAATPAVAGTAGDGAVARTETTPVGERRFRAPAVRLLVGLAAVERDAVVLRSVVSALGHLGDVRAVRSVAGFRTHGDEVLRWSVALTLTTFAGDDDAALGFLIGMTGDGSALVRDWACFGLHQTHRDTPEVRGALLARVADHDPVTRAEALRGLAALGDARAAEPLAAALRLAARNGDETGEVADLLGEARELLDAAGTALEAVPGR